MKNYTLLSNKELETLNGGVLLIIGVAISAIYAGQAVKESIIGAYQRGYDDAQR